MIIIQKQDLMISTRRNDVNWCEFLLRIAPHHTTSPSSPGTLTLYGIVSSQTLR
jgi:hypothetical protein